MTQAHVVEPILETVNESNILGFLTKFTGFYNRYYKSSYGAESSKFLVKHLSAFPRQKDVKFTVKPVSKDWAKWYSLNMPGSRAV